MNLRSFGGCALKLAGELACRFFLNLILTLTMIGVLVAMLVVAAQIDAAQSRFAAVPAKNHGTVNSTRKIESISSNPAVAAATRRYIESMVRNNRLQGENLNTYQKSFLNNWNTLVKLERRILDNPQSLCDPVIREVYEKVQAALDSAQVFSDTTEDIEYTAGGRRLMFPDGTVMTVPEDPVRRKARTSEDYSGAARMTDEVVQELSSLLKKSK